MKRDLTPKQAKFARLLFERGNQSEAYRGSYNVENMSESSINGAASELAANPLVVAYIERMEADAAYVAELNVSWVLRRYMEIATADPNELIEGRRVCCRHCHGVGFKYQWRDAEEWALEVARVMEKNARNAKRGKDAPSEEPIPTMGGGVGFWATKEPHPDCPHCFGKGELDVHINDTRKLSPTAKRLYAGIKTTNNGIEVKMRDQDGALAFLAKYLGLDKKTVEVSGPGGGPVQSISAVTTDPTEAAKIYAGVMTGKA